MRFYLCGKVGKLILQPTNTQLMLLFDLNLWWDALNTFQQVYWITAFLSSIAFAIILSMTLLGGDADTDADVELDADADADGGMGVQFFTVKNMVGFFTVFSWSGLACIELGLGGFATLAISIVCGFIMMVIMAYLFYFMSNMVESGTLRINQAVNAYGEVYLTIPSKRGGIGKIQIKLQGSLREMDAITDSEEDLTRGTLVKVIDTVNDSILLVSK